jgi:hypothetical protein
MSKLELAADAAAAAALAWLALVFAGVVPAARFARERIEITVRPGRIDVDGTYAFRNPLPFPILQGLSYPIPVDAAHPEPATIDAALLGGEDAPERSLGWYRLAGSPHFSVPVPAGGTARVRVRYSQDSPGVGTYLLTTTRPWGRPLDRGEYQLKPVGVRIARSSYPLDGADGLSFARDGFMPDRDWRFEWQAD